MTQCGTLIVQTAVNHIPLNTGLLVYALQHFGQVYIDVLYKFMFYLPVLLLA